MAGSIGSNEKIFLRNSGLKRILENMISECNSTMFYPINLIFHHELASVNIFRHWNTFSLHKNKPFFALISAYLCCIIYHPPRVDGEVEIE